MPKGNKKQHPSSKKKEVAWEEDDYVEDEAVGTDNAQNRMSRGSSSKKSKAKIIVNSKKKEKNMHLPEGRYMTKVGGKSGLRINDVLLGRGPKVVAHTGNVKYRLLVYLARPVYVKCHRNIKSDIARLIGKMLQAMDPPGRYVEYDESATNGALFLVPIAKVLDKTCQAMRERKMGCPPGYLDLVRAIYAEADEENKAALLTKATGMCPEQFREIRKEMSRIISKNNLQVEYLSGVTPATARVSTLPASKKSTSALKTKKKEKKRKREELEDESQASSADDAGVSSTTSRPGALKGSQKIKKKKSKMWWPLITAADAKVSPTTTGETTASAAAKDNTTVVKGRMRRASSRNKDAHALISFALKAHEEEGSSVSSEVKSEPEQLQPLVKKKSKRRASFGVSKTAKRRKTTAKASESVDRTVSDSAIKQPVAERRVFPAKSPRYLYSKSKPENEKNDCHEEKLSTEHKQPTITEENWQQPVGTVANSQGATESRVSEQRNEITAANLDEAFSALPPNLTAFVSGMFSNGAFGVTSNNNGQSISPRRRSPGRSQPHESPVMERIPQSSEIVDGALTPLPPNLTSLISGMYGANYQEFLSSMAKHRENALGAPDAPEFLPPAFTSFLSGIFGEKLEFKTASTDAARNDDKAQGASEDTTLGLSPPSLAANFSGLLPGKPSPPGPNSFLSRIFLDREDSKTAASAASDNDKIEESMNENMMVPLPPPLATSFSAILSDEKLEDGKSDFYPSNKMVASKFGCSSHRGVDEDDPAEERISLPALPADFIGASKVLGAAQTENNSADGRSQISPSTVVVRDLSMASAKSARSLLDDDDDEEDDDDDDDDEGEVEDRKISPQDLFHLNEPW